MRPRTALCVAVALAAVLLTFIAGFLARYAMQRRSLYLTSREYLQRLGIYPAGKLRAGTYYVPLAPGRDPVVVKVTASRRSGVRKVQVGYTGVLFVYDASSRRYGVPTASIATGEGKGAWIDIGLKGRWAIRSRQHHGVQYRLSGKWVSLRELRFSRAGTSCYYRGRRYVFDRTVCDWEPAPSGAGRPGPLGGGN